MAFFNRFTAPSTINLLIKQLMLTLLVVNILDQLSAVMGLRQYYADVNGQGIYDGYNSSLAFPDNTAHYLNNDYSTHHNLITNWMSRMLSPHFYVMKCFNLSPTA